MKLLRQSVEFNQSQAEEYKKSLQESDTERQKLELQVTTQIELISGLQGAADQARAEGRKEMEGELEAKLKEAYDDGYRRAEDNILDQILEVEAELKAQQHIESFKLGYIKCLDDAGVGSEDERRASIEVPPLVVAESGARESTEKAADASNEQAPSEQPQSATPSPGA